MVSRQGYAYQFSVDQIPSTGIRSKGVKAMSFGQKDALAYGCAVHPGCHTVLFATTMGGLKRIKIEEIAELSRPARGSLICKKNKTNPSVLYRNMAVDAGSTILFTDPAVHEIPASEIPLKKSDTGFSQTVDLHPGFLIQKGIEE
ncbi:MAG: DNA gyrase C-terminal beta-propeller domain-containing protein, partial [Lactimicrobium massiliense]